jgi:hypothetical protein
MHVARTTRYGLIALALAIASHAPQSIAAAQEPPARQAAFQWAGQLSPGQSVEIKGVNGPIHAEPSPSGQVEVSAIKSGRRSDPAAVRIEVVPHANGVTVCAVYPDVDGEPNRCAAGRGGRMNTRDNDVKVEFTVKVPAGANLVARTVNGGVDVRDLDGRVDIATVNGSVDFSTQGTGTAKTVNGSIRGKLGRTDWSDTIELETVNGSIVLDLPVGADADVDARTVHGRIESSLPLTLKEASSRSLRGTLGAGGRGLSLGTVNGSITLRAGA